jgi:diguanylate cyclase (GGDEF)-like protein
VTTGVSDTARVEVLEEQVRELQVVYTQLVAYADDLNRTYQQLRLRLQQMTAMTDLATRFARARSVDTCVRACLDGIDTLFPGAVGRVYLEDGTGVLKAVGERTSPFLARNDESLDAMALRAIGSERPLGQRDPEAAGAETFHLAAVALRVRGRVVGALAAGRPRQPFDEDDVGLVDLLGSSTAVAIANVRLYQQTRKMAITDPTTGLFNLRHFRAVLAQEVQKAKRLKYPLGMIMADVDHFKELNDAFGHPSGNVALRTIARAIVQSLRQTDTVARYGGEEFAAILPGCDPAALLQVAEKVRQSVARAPIHLPRSRQPVHVTISVGGAWQDASDADASALLAAADEALYTAKDLGRNRSHIRS